MSAKPTLTPAPFARSRDVTETATAQSEYGTSLFRAMWRFRLPLLIAAGLAAMGGFLLSSAQADVYQAEARIYLSDVSGLDASIPALPTGWDQRRYVRNQADRVLSSPVLSRALQQVTDAETLRDLRARVEVIPPEDLDALTIIGLGATPESAAQVADSVGRAYEEVTQERIEIATAEAITELEGTRDELAARLSGEDAAGNEAIVTQISAIEGQISQLRIATGLYGAGVEFFEPASLPTSPVRPRPLRDAAMAVALVLIIGGLVAWWRASTTVQLERAEDAQVVLAAPLLGEIPHYRSFGAAHMPLAQGVAGHSPLAEAYAMLMTATSFTVGNRGECVLAVTSVQQGDGKTSTAANLALAGVRDNRAVLLVDGDERVHGLTSQLQLTPGPGLEALAAATSSATDFTQEWITADGTVVPVLAAGGNGQPGGTYQPRAAEFRNAIRTLRARGGLVLIDSPPVLAVADASMLAAQADAIILVVAHGTSVELLEEACRRLTLTGTPILGYVFTKADTRQARAKGYRYEEALTHSRRSLWKRAAQRV